MIYNTRNRSTTESHRKKKKPVLILILKGVYSWNKMWSLESFWDFGLKKLNIYKIHFCMFNTYFS